MGKKSRNFSRVSIRIPENEWFLATFRNRAAVAKAYLQVAKNLSFREGKTWDLKVNPRNANAQQTIPGSGSKWVT